MPRTIPNMDAHERTRRYKKRETVTIYNIIGGGGST